MSTPFKVDIDDMEFVFFDQLKVADRLKDTQKYADIDEDTYKQTFAEAKKVAEEVLSPINAVGDRIGCKVDDKGNVTTPEGFQHAWNTLAEGGWIAPSASPELGGVGLPKSVEMGTLEFFVSGAMAFMMYPGLSAAAARMVEEFGDATYKELVATKLFTGEWGGTMCLTESGAGSSVGDNRAKATPADGEDGVYLIEGEKIFISGGDSDLVSNIVHLVLARTPDSPQGTKGLSLFLVPKFNFNFETGELGDRNGAKVVGLEHKMGINGSATCTVAFGSEGPCRGWLIGKEREGITQMFKMMNEARIGVAAQGTATSTAAYAYALQYARDRVQGTKLGQRDSEDGRVNIAKHPDVRRMLMTLKVISETSRAVCMRMAFMDDLARTTSDEKVRDKLDARADLLIPVLKAHLTDLSMEMASLAVQVYGGYGYTQEYPVEQLVRDAKIQAIYEGTNGIQAMDLLGRKMRIQNGALFMGWMSEAQSDLKAGAEEGFKAQTESLGKAIGQLGACAMHLGKVAGGGDIDGAFVHAVPFLRAFGTVVLGLEALDQARVAKKIIDDGKGTSLHKGKVANLDFYVAHILPAAIAFAKTVQSGDRSCLEDVLFAAE
ncbi:MAG: acyl-CoA dehydrogenase [Myxococcota bacterium]